MNKIRVLIVAEELATRRLLTKALEGLAQYETILLSETGAAVIEVVARARPQIVILGVPASAGPALETLESLQMEVPKLPVLAAGTLVSKGAPITIDVLSRGVRGYTTLPPDSSSSGALDVVRESLVRQMRSAVAPSVIADPPRVSAPRPRDPSLSFDILAIGASTGGPNVLASIIEKLPKGFPIPIVIVQHMPPLFTRSLAERLDQSCSIRVREAGEGDVIAPATAWVAPGDRHLVLRRAGSDVRLGLFDGPPENSCRPSVDVLFRSVAQAFGARALGVVLTGMGCDGLSGCREIRAAGGAVLVQDEATSVVWGMPGHVAEAGLADEILPLDRIADAILGRVRAGDRKA
jgi:two-component system, chemotaxis family, protein-glutamate methylesterase/glutaminase